MGVSQNLAASNLIKNVNLEPTVLPDGRWLLFDRAGGSIVTLTAPYGIFWELCDGKTPLELILAELRDLYPDTESATLEAEVPRMIDRLLAEGLIAYQARNP